MMFGFVIGNFDMYMKNFGLLYLLFGDVLFVFVYDVVLMVYYIDIDGKVVLVVNKKYCYVDFIVEDFIIELCVWGVWCFEVLVWIMLEEL